MQTKENSFFPKTKLSKLFSKPKAEQPITMPKSVTQSEKKTTKKNKQMGKKTRELDELQSFRPSGEIKKQKTNYCHVYNTQRGDSVSENLSGSNALNGTSKPTKAFTSSF